MLKKIYTLFTIILCCLCLVSCKDKQKEPDTLKVGINVDFPPFEYYENGEPAGLDVELANIIGEKLNKQVILEEMEFNTLFAALSTNKIDVIISGVDITEERKKTFNFSDGYYNNELSLIVKEGDTTIAAIEDLQGKKVGTELGTTSDTYADSLDSITNVKYNSGAVAVMNLKAGKVDAVILDKPVAQQVLLTNDGCQILEGVKLVSSEIGVVINKNNPELLKQINGVIKELKETGKLQELIAKYFSTEKAVETTETEGQEDTTTEATSEEVEATTVQSTTTENTENTVTSETTDEVVNTATNEAADEVENATTSEEVKEKTTEQSTTNAEDNK